MRSYEINVYQPPGAFCWVTDRRLISTNPENWSLRIMHSF